MSKCYHIVLIVGLGMARLCEGLLGRIWPFWNSKGVWNRIG